MQPLLIIVGQRYGQLTILEKAPSTKKGIQWKCRCDCGTTLLVLSSRIKAGSIQSCGCLRKKLAAARGRRQLWKHGHAAYRGESLTYSSWRSMVARCTDTNNIGYADYGGRGIKIYVPWLHNFECFLKDVGERPTKAHTLDRINTNGDYEPGNVRWALPVTQANNRRNNINVTIAGSTRSIAEWSVIAGLPYYTIYTRVKRGWPADQLLSEAHQGLAGARR